MATAISACAGRLSAELEHQWLMQDVRAGQTEIRRAHIHQIHDALIEHGYDAIAGRAHLLRAKVAHASLLRRATFNADIDDAAWAERRAAVEIASCNALMMPLASSS